MKVDANVHGKISDLCDAVEPLCGFRPEGMAQAISLLATRLTDTMAAIEALGDLAREIDLAEIAARSED